MALFIKFDGVDGEANDKDHKQWSDLLSMSWGLHKAGGGATGQTRRRGVATVEDVVMHQGIRQVQPETRRSRVVGQGLPQGGNPQHGHLRRGSRDLPQVRVEERDGQFAQHQRRRRRRRRAHENRSR